MKLKKLGPKSNLKLKLAQKDEIERNQTLIPKILMIYNKFAWNDEIGINQNFDTKNIMNSSPIRKIQKMRI